jgi:hypothetical protein
MCLKVIPSAPPRTQGGNPVCSRNLLLQRPLGSTREWVAEITWQQAVHAPHGKACRSSRGSIPQPDPAVAYQPTALKQQNAPAPPYNLQMECTGFERGGTWQLGLPARLGARPQTFSPEWRGRLRVPEAAPRLCP